MKMTQNFFLKGNEFAAETEKENLSDFFLNSNESATKTEKDFVFK